MPPKPDEKEFPGLAKTEVDENLFPSEENHGDEVEEEESLLAKEAERLYDDDKVDQAAKILRSLEDHLLEEKHHAMLR
jgi:hypothetical protein